MKVTSEQVLKDIKDGLDGVDPTKVRTIRMIAHPEAEILAQALAPEALVDTFGACGNIMYTVTTHGPSEGKLVNVKVFYINPSDAPKPDFKQADEAIKKATTGGVTELLARLKSLRHDKQEAKSVLKLIEAATPVEGDPPEVVISKLALVPTIIDKMLAIKTDNPGLWATFIEQIPGDMKKGTQNAKNILNTVIDSCRKLLILLD